MIELKHLKKEYAQLTPLKDVSTIINNGDVIAVIGPSGTGKSTLLRCINMLEKPTSGEIVVDGEVITDPKCDLSLVRRKVGMVFQSFNLFGHLTVIENLMNPQIDLLKKSRQEAYDKGMELLEKVGMAGHALQYPDQLSGGQKQRVAIARTLAMDPEVILFDEPTSALDPTMVGEVQSVIRDLAKTGITMMIVTHDMKFAREISNRVFFMDQGGIYEDGTPEEIFKYPKKERTIQFIRQMKVLELTAEKGKKDLPSCFSRIENYCHSGNVPEKIMMRSRLIFEELYRQLLGGEIPTITKMNITYEYDTSRNRMKVTVLYNGASYSPEATTDELSRMILQASIVEEYYEHTSGGEYGNKVTMTVRND